MKMYLSSFNLGWEHGSTSAPSPTMAPSTPTFLWALPYHPSVLDPSNEIFYFLYPPALTVISLDMLLRGLAFVYAGGSLIFIFYNYYRNKGLLNEYMSEHH